MLVHLDLSRLEELKRKASALKTKRGKWKKSTLDSSQMEKIFKEYAQFWMDVVRKHVPEYDPAKHKINVLAIEVSAVADAIIAGILPGSLFFMYSPRMNPELKEDECIIHVDKVLVDRNDEAPRWKDVSGGEGDE